MDIITQIATAQDGKIVALIHPTLWAQLQELGGTQGTDPPVVSMTTVRAIVVSSKASITELQEARDKITAALVALGEE
jgi:hypothetical protein